PAYATLPQAPLSSALSLHDALPIYEKHAVGERALAMEFAAVRGRVASILESTHGQEVLAHGVREIGGGAIQLVEKLRIRVREVRSEEHTSELQSRADHACGLQLDTK